VYLMQILSLPFRKKFIVPIGAAFVLICWAFSQIGTASLYLFSFFLIFPSIAVSSVRQAKLIVGRLSRVNIVQSVVTLSSLRRSSAVAVGSRSYCYRSLSGIVVRTQHEYLLIYSFELKSAFGPRQRFRPLWLNNTYNSKSV